VSLVDTHCHIYMPALKSRLDDVLSRAVDRGLSRLLIVGADEASSFEALSLAKEISSIRTFAAVGVHPHDAKELNGVIPEELISLGENEHVIAIGETGLDYYRNLSPASAQRDIFAKHIEWAKSLKKPLICHIRDAYDEALAILKSEGAHEVGGILHCFQGNKDHAMRAIDMGFYISFACNITYKKNEILREVSASIPLDRVLCETDSPYLSPENSRGKVNEPANVSYVYETIASLRGMPFDELTKVVMENSISLLGW
jgi:TatD DNase family protein